MLTCSNPVAGMHLACKVHQGYSESGSKRVG